MAFNPGRPAPKSDFDKFIDQQKQEKAVDNSQQKAPQIGVDEKLEKLKEVAKKQSGVIRQHEERIRALEVQIFSLKNIVKSIAAKANIDAKGL